MKKLLEENKTLTQIVSNARRPSACLDSISQNFLQKIQLTSIHYEKPSYGLEGKFASRAL